MPNLIKPSQLEKNLPEETDTVAKALLKYLKFTITFWRWFKGIVKSDGNFTDDFKQQLCGLGCAGKNINPNEGEVGPDPGTNDTPPSTPPPSGEVGCCNEVLDKDNNSFTYFNVSGALTNENYIDLKCINNTRYAVVKNLGHDVNLTSNQEFTDVLDGLPIILSESPHDEDSTGNFQVDLNGNKIIYPEHMGGGVETGIMWNVWPHVEVLIWGQTPKLIDNKGKSNHHLVGQVELCNVKKVDFLMKNNDFWMARLIVTDLRGALRKESSTFDTDYFFSNFSLNLKITNDGGLIVREENSADQINRNENRFFPTHIKQGERNIHQSVLTKIGGIRVSVFNKGLAESSRLFTGDYLEGNETPLPYGLGYANSYGWNTVLTIFEERWLDEDPEGCYYNAIDSGSFSGMDSLQFLWTNRNTNQRPFFPNYLKNWVIDRGRIFFDNYQGKK